MTTMSTMYVCRPFDDSSACLKVVNDRGEVLSIAFDDSCGAFKDLKRNFLRTHAEDGQSPIDEDWVTPERFLQALAAHLAK